jgi:hypothetical protein
MPNIISWGIAFLTFVYCFECIVNDSGRYKPTSNLGEVDQQKLTGTMTELLTDGQMIEEGWMVDHPPIINN